VWKLRPQPGVSTLHPVLIQPLIAMCDRCGVFSLLTKLKP
jgi:hypothetical protein